MTGELYRIDQLLVRNGLSQSRTQAKALIDASLVTCDGDVILKASTLFRETADIVVTGEIHPWVSRGGQKLAAALDFFQIDVAGFVCLDLGASTGGFTDVLISNGASKSYAVDVGSGQLADKLRANEIVINLEKTDARNLSVTLIPDPIDILVCDVSFISLTKILPVPMKLVKEGGTLICLVKPQFEVGQGQVGKKGIVRDVKLSRSVLKSVSLWLDARRGWRVLDSIESPILGVSGNREFLVACSKEDKTL